MKHFDNPVWPGATGALFTVLTRAEAQANLIPSFRALAANLDTRSNGLVLDVDEDQGEQQDRAA